jgi:hypothetical protein
VASKEIRVGWAESKEYVNACLSLSGLLLGRHIGLFTVLHARPLGVAQRAKVVEAAIIYVLPCCRRNRL